MSSSGDESDGTGMGEPEEVEAPNDVEQGQGAQSPSPPPSAHQASDTDDQQNVDDATPPPPQELEQKQKQEQEQEQGVEEEEEEERETEPRDSDGDGEQRNDKGEPANMAEQAPEEEKEEEEQEAQEGEPLVHNVAAGGDADGLEDSASSSHESVEGREEGEERRLDEQGKVPRKAGGASVRSLSSSEGDYNLDADGVPADDCVEADASLNRSESGSTSTEESSSSNKNNNNSSSSSSSSLSASQKDGVTTRVDQAGVGEDPTQMIEHATTQGEEGPGSPTVDDEQDAQEAAQQDAEQPPVEPEVAPDTGDVDATDEPTSGVHEEVSGFGSKWGSQDLVDDTQDASAPPPRGEEQEQEQADDDNDDDDNDNNDDEASARDLGEAPAPTALDAEPVPLDNVEEQLRTDSTPDSSGSAVEQQEGEVAVEDSKQEEDVHGVKQQGRERERGRSASTSSDDSDGLDVDAAADPYVSPEDVEEAEDQPEPQMKQQQQQQQQQQQEEDQKRQEDVVGGGSTLKDTESSAAVNASATESNESLDVIDVDAPIKDEEFEPKRAPLLRRKSSDISYVSIAEGSGASSSNASIRARSPQRATAVMPAVQEMAAIETALYDEADEDPNSAVVEDADVHVEETAGTSLTYRPTRRIPPPHVVAAIDKAVDDAMLAEDGERLQQEEEEEEEKVGLEEEAEEEAEEQEDEKDEDEDEDEEEEGKQVRELEQEVRTDKNAEQEATTAATAATAAGAAASAVESQGTEGAGDGERAADAAVGLNHSSSPFGTSTKGDDEEGSRHSSIASRWRWAAGRANKRDSSTEKTNSSRKSMFEVVKEAQFASKFKTGLAKFFGVSDDNQLARWEEFYMGDEEEEEEEEDEEDGDEGDGDEEEEEEEEEDELSSDEEEGEAEGEGEEEEEKHVEKDEPPHTLQETNMDLAAAGPEQEIPQGRRRRSTAIIDADAPESDITEESEHPYDRASSRTSSKRSTLSKRVSLQRAFSPREPEPDEMMPMRRIVAGAIRNTIRRARRRSQATEGPSPEADAIQMRAVPSAPPLEAQPSTEAASTEAGMVQFGVDPSRGRAGRAAQAARQPKPAAGTKAEPRLSHAAHTGTAAVKPKARKQPAAADPRRARPAAGRRPRSRGASAGAVPPTRRKQGDTGERRARQPGRRKRVGKKEGLDTLDEKLMSSIREHRPFFTYYMTFCQLAVMIIAVLVYGLAPIGLEPQTRTATVDGPDGTPIQASYEEEANFWIGPSPTALVLMGAKFTPCMRRDARIFDEVIGPIKEAEKEYGCCVEQGSRDGNCFSSSADDCTGFREFVPGEICGGPQCCTDYKNGTSVTYPNCEYQPSDSTQDPTCSCTISARPCCTSLAGDCSIQSQQYCDFIGGHYHPNAELCSQVSCLESVCGLVDFLRENRPDQWYRLYLAMFLHVGFVHLFFVILMQHSFAVEIEKLAGWLRMFFIYMLSGIGGYLASANFTPYQVSTGASPALYGLLGCLFVELFQSWQLLESPWREFIKLFVISIISLAVGLLPYIDNWSHIGGFTCGILSSIVFLPYITFGKWNATRKCTLILIALPVLIAIFTVLAVLLATRTIDCSWCGVVNCYNFTETFCSDHLQEVI